MRSSYSRELRSLRLPKSIGRRECLVRPITKRGLVPNEKHRNSLMVKMIFDEADKIQPSIRQIIESLKSLEPHITRARYPIRRGVQLLPPSKLYLRKDAEFALSSARRVLLLMKNLEKS